MSVKFNTEIRSSDSGSVIRITPLSSTDYDSRLYLFQSYNTDEQEDEASMALNLEEIRALRDVFNTILSSADSDIVDSED